jgi:hypothetical protein
MLRSLPLATLLAGMMLVLASGFVPSGAMAQEACVPPPMRTDIRPPGDGPTVVEVTYYVVDFMGVDDANQQIELDIQAMAKWTDTRLAGLVGCRLPLTSVWYPRMYLLNSSNLRRGNTQARDQILIGEEGRVFYLQRLTGTISSYHSLRRFPFDSHDFRIDMALVEHSVDELVLRPGPRGAGISDRLNVEGWSIRGVQLTTAEEAVGDSEVLVPTATLTISADRQATYYIYRVLGLLMLVVAMSWVVFFVPPERVEFQIGLGATAMLTAIAFSLSLASSLPTLGYLTVLDSMLVWAIFLVFLSIVESLVTGNLASRGRQETAVRMDWISRFAFPAMLFAGWGAMLAGVELP